MASGEVPAVAGNGKLHKCSVVNAVNCSSFSLPNEVIWRKTGQSASVPCTLSCSAHGMKFQWFAFKENFHHQVNLDTMPPKYSLEGASLHIMSLNTNDSGTYHCAVIFEIKGSGTQMIGSGTTLVVKEDKQMVGDTLMWLAFALLAIYSVAVMILIILKKNGRSINRQIATSHKSQKNSTKRMQFRAVMQEFCNKRNLEKTTPNTSRQPPQNKVESTQHSHSADDIYQNL
ncbi:uncharacterized protein LOC115363346 isoform X1 [Myripristis murdjan]|uniref:uncharacterized protein LOC115363346 isoform X1 n=1 Tax=Myripristis murdjan TaxID=586833 RepID=UPI001175D239|nr:uncharacterized protein LOC115363346 isoform X1 [Myripristis murdjan]